MRKITLLFTMLVCCLLFQGCLLPQKMKTQERQSNSIGITGIEDEDMKSIADLIDELQAPVKDFAERNKILDFIEKFRTAYNCMDIKYIENVFSNKLNEYKNDFQVRSKKEYFNNLRKVFKRKEFINVSFDSIQVSKVRGRKIYGVSLYQRWSSTTYRDKGYLFLLIDCRREDEMHVFFRAWTPEKVFDLNSFSDFVTL